MATFKNGILGGFSGKVGTVVGVQNGDEYYMRALPRKRFHFTANELANQAKMGMVQNYLSPFKDLLKVGFYNYYTKTGGFRGALAYTRTKALVTDSDGFHIDPSLVKISGGNLEPAINPTMSLINTNEIRIIWETNQVNYLNEADQLMALVYDPLNASAIMRIFNGGFRKDGTLEIKLKPRMRNVLVNVYIGFVAANRESQSDSQYLGQIQID